MSSGFLAFGYVSGPADIEADPGWQLPYLRRRIHPPGVWLPLRYHRTGHPASAASLPEFRFSSEISSSGFMVHSHTGTLPDTIQILRADGESAAVTTSGRSCLCPPDAVALAIASIWFRLGRNFRLAPEESGTWIHETTEILYVSLKDILDPADGMSRLRADISAGTGPVATKRVKELGALLPILQAASPDEEFSILSSLCGDDRELFDLCCRHLIREELLPYCDTELIRQALADIPDRILMPAMQDPRRARWYRPFLSRRRTQDAAQFAHRGQPDDPDTWEFLSAKLSKYQRRIAASAARMPMYRTARDHESLPVQTFTPVIFSAPVSGRIAVKFGGRVEDVQIWTEGPARQVRCLEFRTEGKGATDIADTGFRTIRYTGVNDGKRFQGFARIR